MKKEFNWIAFIFSLTFSLSHILLFFCWFVSKKISLGLSAESLIFIGYHILININIFLFIMFLSQFYQLYIYTRLSFYASLFFVEVITFWLTCLGLFLNSSAQVSNLYSMLFFMFYFVYCVVQWIVIKKNFYWIVPNDEFVYYKDNKQIEAGRKIKYKLFYNNNIKGIMHMGKSIKKDFSNIFKSFLK